MYIELYLDLSMYAFLNLKKLDWDTKEKAVEFSNALAIIHTILMVPIPVCMVLFHVKNISKWNDEEFSSKHSSFADGTRKDFKTRQWIVLVIPSMFIIRRIILSLTIVFWMDFFWGQVAFQFIVSTFMVMFI